MSKAFKKLNTNVPARLREGKNWNVLGAITKARKKAPPIHSESESKYMLRVMRSIMVHVRGPSEILLIADWYGAAMLLIKNFVRPAEISSIEVGTTFRRI